MKKYLSNILPIISLIILFTGCNNMAQNLPETVSPEKMQEIYNEIKTPYKYGLIMAPENVSLKIDCPTVFRKDKQWFMSYFIFDGRGYETWLAKSDDLLNWEELGKIMTFSDSTDWDANQKAGYPSLQDPIWGGSYELQQVDGKYWMPYFGGNSQGYEKGLLSIGMAFTEELPSVVHDWERFDKPLIMAADKDARWWENSTIYKAWVLFDESKTTGYPYVMYYNARGDSINPARGAERIGMAVSTDMVNWDRFGTEPIINHHKGISGDAIIQKIDDVWVMFYFGAFWPERKDHDAFNRFACSYDLVNWTEWEGEDLIAPSESYDNWFAHKSCVVKYNGIVYHFYCAVNRNNDRGIAVATSKDLGESQIHFKPKAEVKK